MSNEEFAIFQDSEFSEGMEEGGGKRQGERMRREKEEEV